MAKCPYCGKYVEPNYFGKKTIQCKKCLSVLIENKERARVARLGFLLIVFVLPIFLYLYVTDSVNIVFFIMAPLAITYINLVTKYEKNT